MKTSKSTSSTIGAFDAKTHLSKLLEEVRGGTEFTITKRGKPVAKLVPFTPEEKAGETKNILEAFCAIRTSVKGFVNIKKYIAEGRKH